MAYRKYPWHRFQYWLRQQPDHAIAGYRSSPGDNVIARFLKTRIQHRVSVFRCSNVDLAAVSHKSLRFQTGPLPEWVARFMALIEADSERPSYTFTTCRRIMRQVSEELRYERKDITV